MTTKNKKSIILIAYCKTAVTPLLTHWSYCGLVPSRGYIHFPCFLSTVRSSPLSELCCGLFSIYETSMDDIPEGENTIDCLAWWASFTSLTLRDLNEMTDGRRHFQVNVLEWKLIIDLTVFLEVPMSSISSGSGLSPNRRRAITWTHYNDVIMGAIASQITSLTIVYSTVYSDADQIKHQSSASLAFVRGIHRGPVVIYSCRCRQRQ